MKLVNKAHLGKQPKRQTRLSIKTARRTPFYLPLQRPSERRKKTMFLDFSLILRTKKFPTMHQGSKDPRRQV